MHRARSKVMAAPNTMERSVAASADPPREEAERGSYNIGINIPNVILHSTIVSVPLPSRSRTSSDGKIRLFSSGRSRSSSSRNSLGSIGTGGNYWTLAELYLTNTTLCYRLKTQGQVCEMLLEDLVGVQYEAAKGGKTCELTVHLYPQITKLWAKKKVRRLVSLTVLFDRKEIQKENEDEAALWKKKILIQANIASREIFVSSDVMKDSDNDDESVLTPRNFLVLLNPMAGSRKGESRYNTYVKPMFELADIKCTVIITKHQNHAQEMVKDMDLSKYDAIIISSGDGLLYEVINGIMERSDWKEIIKIPFGMLPTGSGNALAAATLYESQEEFSLETAAFQIIRGGFSSMDMASIQASDGKSCYMLLLACWGLIADVDIESETMRKIGEARFTLGALNCIRKKKVYRGRLSYLVPESSTGEPEAVPVESEVLESEPLDLSSENDPELSLSSIGPESSLSSIGGKMESLKESVFDNGSSDNNGSSVSLSQDGSTEYNGESIDGVANGICPDQSLFIRKTEANVECGPKADLLVPLNEELPDTWKTVEQDFLTVAALMIPTLSRTVIGDPHFQMGSGKMRLLWVDGSISRFGTLKMFTDSETGKHIDINEVKLIDAKAFRIEPLNEDGNGIMTLDGERIEKYGSIQGQVHPHMAVVMTRRRRKPEA